jgi:tyrosinase
MFLPPQSAVRSPFVARLVTIILTNQGLSYWDWSLDWLNLTTAPVWSSDLGFGTDGNATDLESIHGHCVTDGPFANLEVLYVEKYPYLHCLSRDFARGEALLNFSQAIRPAALHELLKIEDYETFNLAVENGPHLSIPRFVHGDFSTITAPAGESRSFSCLFCLFWKSYNNIDPVFFLHHTQLDRLWWRWQQVDVSRRLGGSAMKGRAGDNKENAWAREMLAYNRLAPDVLVEEIVVTESDVLCYRY